MCIRHLTMFTVRRGICVTHLMPALMTEGRQKQVFGCELKKFFSIFFRGLFLFRVCVDHVFRWMCPPCRSKSRSCSSASSIHRLLKLFLPSVKFSKKFALIYDTFIILLLQHLTTITVTVIVSGLPLRYGQLQFRRVFVNRFHVSVCIIVCL